MPRGKLGGAAVLCAALAGGCAPPSEYRHTAYVPAARPLPWDGRTGAEGSLRLEGAASATFVRQNLTPKLGDTALNVPELTLDGLGAIAVTGGLELGVRGSYADYAWRRESARGTMPIPSRPAVWGFGPEVRGMLRLNDSGRFTLGFGGNLLGYSVTEARWQLDETCRLAPGCVDAASTEGLVRYRLVATESNTFLIASVAVYWGADLDDKGKFGHVFVGPSAHEGFRNAGFTNSDAIGSKSSLERAGLVGFAGAGYGIELSGVRASVMISLPFTSDESAVDYGPISAFATLGGDIPLWQKD
jgi:hypothetical protein